MNSEMNELFNRHSKWLKTAGRRGKQLTLDKIASEQLTDGQLLLLTDSFLTECSFKNIAPDGIDLYHTEMHSCKFDDSMFRGAQFVKSEINYTEFTNTSFENANFDNAEFYDCIFRKCVFINSVLAGAGIWNSAFKECVFKNIDFDSICIDNAIFENCRYINPSNPENAVKLKLNIGTTDNPIPLSRENSIKLIKTETV